MPPAGHALRAEVGGSIIFVTPGVFAGQHKKLPFGFIVDFVVFTVFELEMLAMVGRPSLYGYDACMVSWVSGHPGEIAGKTMVRPLFLLKRFFCLVEILKKRFWGFSGIYE